MGGKGPAAALAIPIGCPTGLSGLSSSEFWATIGILPLLWLIGRLVGLVLEEDEEWPNETSRASAS
ncbi:hypothetical protein I79_020204 [Cricetulus griseus]|uniref:Uncharacterized protein n=1 Tax=Cricetulus griseus TaxID=10029 RepID=G3I9G2_CRIGR|nr:hypothetical protein I79_020204 [Cricetulus griseus]